MKKYSEADLDRLVLTTFEQTCGQFGILDKTWTEFIRDERGRQLALQNGLPDLVGHLHGYHIEIEDKKQPNGPTPQQYARLRRVIKTGGLGAMIVLGFQGDVRWVHPEWIMAMDFTWRDREKWLLLGQIDSSISLMPILAWAINKKNGEKK